VSEGEAEEKPEASVSERKEKEKKAEETFKLASQNQRVILGVLLFLISIGATMGWFLIFNSVQSHVRGEYSVAWTPKPGTLLSPGPPSFQFDAGRGRLVARGPIDTSMKSELVSLISSKGVTIFPPNPLGRSYWQALDRLAFESNRESDQTLWLLLLLGGISGFLGVQLRSLVNFVGVTCFKNNLDIDRWWPWYAVRPPQGFIFGLAAMLLLQVGFFQPETGAPDAVIWGIVIALLAGFGAAEFADRLRLLAKTLFGESSN
jgi:hypothetical protein